jgi:hypothetical protein
MRHPHEMRGKLRHQHLRRSTVRISSSGWLNRCRGHRRAGGSGTRLSARPGRITYPLVQSSDTPGVVCIQDFAFRRLCKSPTSTIAPRYPEMCLQTAEVGSPCQGPDPLAGNDDPNPILVTCSQDRTQIYLLDKSIVTGEQIEYASLAFSQQIDQYAVDMKFKPAAATPGRTTPPRTSARRPGSHWTHRWSAHQRSTSRFPVATRKSPATSQPTRPVIL